MYIKQVLIEGFKSYKELVQPEPFSPGVNCVIGANGSGKSNFFYAIRFVLSDLFQNMRQEDRQALLHEGTGGQVLSAFVEIVFDNSDNRFPVDKDEVRLRRTVGLRKDEYWLNMKNVTKSEVSNLLESAGFSRSNPYYVVQQGKISQLSLMRESERLALLKEIGGARVYEERRKESLKTLQDAAVRRKQIDDVVTHIEERLSELDAEKEELREYQKLDKQRRAIEYTIFEKELHQCKEELEKIDRDRAAAQQLSTEEHDRAQKRDEELREAGSNLGGLASERQGMDAEKQAAEAAKSEALAVLTRAELDAQELQEKLAHDQVLKAQAEAELRDVQSVIRQQNVELESVQQDLDAAQGVEDQAAHSLGDKEKQLDALYQKQGRRSQFSSRAERNTWLQSNINSTQAVVEQKAQQVSSLEEEIAELRNDVTAAEQQQQSKQEELQSIQGQLRACQEAITEQEAQRNALGVERKKVMKEEAECSANLKRIQEEQRHANNEMDQNTPRDLRRGLDSLKRIVRERNLQPPHGCLLELIDCDPVYRTAVEVAGGNNLYNVVVDTDEMAARLVGYLNDEQGGRITFIPLNRATAPRFDYPQNDDVRPLLSVLRFPENVAKACAQVFGRTVLCKDLDVAADVARSGQFDCITMEGSRVERRGAFTGGHHDSKRSKLTLMHTINECGERLQDLDARRRRASEEAAQLDQRISGCLGELEKLKEQQTHLKARAEQLRAEDKASRGDLAAKQQLISAKEKTVDGITRSIEEAEAEVADKQAEMQSPFGVGLTDAEQELMASLPGQIKELRQAHLRAQRQRMAVEGSIRSIETALSENLVRREDELQAQLDHLRIASGSSQAQSMDNEVRMAKDAADEASKEYKRVLGRMAQLDAEIGRLKVKRDELQRQDEENKRRMQDESKALEQLLNHRTVLLQKKEDLNRKIRDLGVLPADAFDKYKKHNLKELHRLLHKCNEGLTKFSHVNKKALDQYASFTEQRQDMQKRQEELNKSDESIKELMEHLDQKKDEALERTFKQVARQFRDTFAELVPGGHGSLVMIRKKPEGDAMDEDSDADEEGRRDEADGRVDKYSGVRVKVSFTGTGDTQSMKQLSGGQKTVVALCLIFAIQRCDPAPFYLFDEIDAALDAQYRSSVANLIQKQASASSTQFILTTFRPELVLVADQLYSVEHRNRVSSVRVVDQGTALKFVTEQGAQADGRRP